ncbi:MAG: hypothetical protein WC793_00015 [Candidatus Paceibacterota bacterium]
MRILRGYRHVARIPHWCDRCFTYIQPGEPYEASVEVHKRRIVVFKTHADGCEYPPEPFEEDSSEEKNIEILAA